VHTHLDRLQVHSGASRSETGFFSQKLWMEIAACGRAPPPDDVLWAECGIRREEHAGARRLERLSRPPRHIPLVELGCQDRARSNGNAFSWPIARITSSASMNSWPTIRSAVMAPFGVEVVFDHVESSCP